MTHHAVLKCSTCSWEIQQRQQQQQLQQQGDLKGLNSLKK